ncbi:MAG: AMP-binding protein [Aestuariibacter sp.]
MFFNELESFSDNTALIAGQSKMTYGELNRACAMVRQQLPEKPGVGLLYCRNDMASVIAYLACLQAKQVVLLLDADVSDSISHQIFACYQPDFVVKDGQAQIVAGGKQAPDKNVTLLLSTSGSTGSPKQVALSAKNIHSNASAIADYLNISAQDVAITTLPMFYSYGLSVINSHLASGAAIVLSNETFMSREFWQALDAHKVTNIAGVPHSYQMLQKLGFLRKSFPHLRYMTQAGGKLDRATVVAFAEYAQNQNLSFFIMYGQTEATARIAYLHPDKVLRKPEAIGQAIPRGNLRLCQPGSELEISQANQIGELIYKGENVMLGYVSNRTELAEIAPLRELRTGDLAYFDEEGDFFISGRLKRFVKITGKRTNLDDVERLLEARGICAKVTGNDQRLDILCSGVLPEKLNIEVGQQLGLHASFIGCHENIDIPITDNGKTDYIAIAKSLGYEDNC